MDAIEEEIINWDEKIFNSAFTSDISVTKLTDTKFAVSYRDGWNSSYWTSVIWEVSWTVITWGTEQVFNSASTWYIFITKLTDTKFVIVYRDYWNSSYWTSIIWEVSWTNMTFWTEQVFNSASMGIISAARLTDTKFVITYSNGWDSYYWTSIIWDVSWTVITYWTAQVFNSSQSPYISAVMLTDKKFVVSYMNNWNSDYWTSIIWDVSWTVITYWTAQVFNSAGTHSLFSAGLTDTKFVVSYMDGWNWGYWTSIIWEVSWTVITWGTEQVFNQGNTNYISVAKITDAKFAVSYRDIWNSYCWISVIWNVNWASIVFWAEKVFNSAVSSFISVARLTNTKFITCYKDEWWDSYGGAIIQEIWIDMSDKIYAIPQETKTAWQTWNVAVAGALSKWRVEVMGSAEMGISVVSLTDTKFVIAYQDVWNSYYWTSVIAEASGTSIAFWTPQVFNLGAASAISAARLTDTKFVIAYRDYWNSSYWTSIVWEVNWTVATYGTEQVFNEADTYYTSAARLTDTKFVVVYQNYWNSFYWTSVIWDVSWTSISYGAAQVFNEAVTDYISAARLTDTKFVVAYRDQWNSNYWTAVIWDISWTVIAFWTEQVYDSYSMQSVSVAWLTDTKFVVSYMDNKWASVIWDVSWTNMTFWAEQTFNSEHSRDIFVEGLTDTKFVVTYRDDWNSYYWTSIIWDVNWTTVDWEAAQVFNEAVTDDISVARLTDTKFVIGYQDEWNSDFWESVIQQIDWIYMKDITLDDLWKKVYIDWDKLSLIEGTEVGQCTDDNEFYFKGI